MEIFDALVVISSFILDVVFLYDDVVGGLAQLIIFLRFWRVIRIINGLILGAKQAADKRFSFPTFNKLIKKFSSGPKCILGNPENKTSFSLGLCVRVGVRVRCEG